MNERTIHGVFWGTIVLLILLMFQYFLFAFLPAVDLNIPDDQQRSEAIRFIVKKDLVVLFQTIVVLGMLFVINRKLLRVDMKTCFVIALAELLILLTSMFFFSLSYVNKFALSLIFVFLNT
jgi:hypothetical protein